MVVVPVNTMDMACKSLIYIISDNLKDKIIDMANLEIIPCAMISQTVHSKTWSSCKYLTYIRYTNFQLRE
jgi:hypothetical protein